MKIQVKLTLNSPRALVITCLSHKGQQFVSILYKGQLSRSFHRVDKFAGRLAVAQGNPTIIVSKTQQVQFIQSNFFTNKTLTSLILFTCFAKFATA